MYSNLSCKLATSFRLFHFSFFQVKMVNHFGVQILQGIGYQLKIFISNPLQTFLRVLNLHQ